MWLSCRHWRILLPVQRYVCAYRGMRANNSSLPKQYSFFLWGGRGSLKVKAKIADQSNGIARGHLQGQWDKSDTPLPTTLPNWLQTDFLIALYALSYILLSALTPSYALNINLVTCYPSCQNGGICYNLYYSPQCYCAVEGTSGSYCQNKGKHNWEHSCQQQLDVESPHACIACFWHAVTCTPACQNGGACHISSSSAHCDCPSGYTGSYCQYSGMCMNVHLHFILYQII